MSPGWGHDRNLCGQQYRHGKFANKACNHPLMSRTSWFQNMDWSESVEKDFREKLRRTRDQSQPLRIQAFCLRRAKPLISLKLLDEYFSLPNRKQDSAAYQHRAEALLTLGRIAEAVDAYLDAMERERDLGAIQTEARRDFAFLVATRKLQQHYQRALSALGNGSDLLFPIQRFTHHGSIALISAELGDQLSARTHAELAIKAAAATTSGLRYHSGLGLVGDDLEQHRRSLARMVACP
jgi:tetratricopeptide (TPR) repeat protein